MINKRLGYCHSTSELKSKVVKFKVPANSNLLKFEFIRNSDISNEKVFRILIEYTGNFFDSSKEITFELVYSDVEISSNAKYITTVECKEDRYLRHVVLVE
jgi:hypothetical protein